MLYLAEIKKQTKGFIAGWRTELKLLARQNNDQTWSNISNEDILASEEIERFGDGVLVMVNLNNNRQIQGAVEPAGLKLVQQLQRLSRLLEKSKEQQEEIDRWKNSLEIQSQAIADKQSELESQYEQLEYLEEKYQKIERERQELEQQWENLRQEQELLSQRGFDLDRVEPTPIYSNPKIEALINRLNSESNSNALWEQLPNAFKAIEESQKILDLHWKELEQKKKDSQNLENQVAEQQQLLQRENQEFQYIKTKIEETKIQWEQQKILLMTKQEIYSRLNFHLQSLEEAQDTLTYAIADSGFVLPPTMEQTVEQGSLENMPMEELEKIVNDLENEVKNSALFVQDQEEELLMESESLEELHQRLVSSIELEREKIEDEILDTQEGKRYLEETLIGQRRTLREKRYILIQHLSVLRHRQGLNDDQRLRLDPVIRQLIKRQDNVKRYWERIEQDIRHLLETTEQLKNTYLEETGKREIKQQEIRHLEDAWEESKTEVRTFRARIKLYEELLHPMQNNINAIRERLESLNRWLKVN